jgi:hypothetical protein
VCLLQCRRWRILVARCPASASRTPPQARTAASPAEAGSNVQPVLIAGSQKGCLGARSGRKNLRKVEGVGDWIATTEVACRDKLPTDAKFANRRLQRRLIAVGCSSALAVPAVPTPCSSRAQASSSYRRAVLVLIPASAGAAAFDIPSAWNFAPTKAAVFGFLQLHRQLPDPLTCAQVSFALF